MFKKVLLSIILILFFLSIIYINKYSFSNDKNINIKPLKEYVLNLKYCINKDDISCFTLPTVPYEVKNVLRNRIIDNEYKAYVSLVFLKIFYSQINHFRQGYQIKEPFTFTTNPLEKAFRKFGKEVISEFNTPDIGYQWICTQKQYLDKYPNINKYCTLINKEYKKIEKNN